MTGNLATALTNLLQTSLPSLLGGATPAVQLEVTSDLLELNTESPDSLASQPRPDDRTDTLTLDPTNPAGPYTLTQPPYPGPRRVWLVTASGERLTLTPKEVVWDPHNSRQFSLKLSPSRDLAGVDTLQVLYSVTAIYTQLEGTQTLQVHLTSDSETDLAQSQALVIAAIELNRQPLIQSAQALYEADDYGAEVAIAQLKLEGGKQLAPNHWQLTLKAKFQLKATRALAEEEGVPIERILTSGQSQSGDRPIDIHIGLEV